MLTQVTFSITRVVGGNIIRAKTEFTVNASNDEEYTKRLIMSDISNSVEYALIAGHILTIKDVVSVYDARIREWGMNDNRGYPAKRKSLKTYLEYHIPEIGFRIHHQEMNDKV